MSQKRPGAYNQALMDLGATVCLPSGAPLCGDCPAGDFCVARQEGRQAQLPVRSPKREKRTEHLTVFLLRRGAAAALRQRPETGLLAGLWEYPHVPGALAEAEAARQLQMWGVRPTKWTKKLSARHIFTHVRWEMTGYVVEVDGLGPGDWLWAEAQQRERLAIPSAFEKFTAELKEGE
jgi:A/G-specific adenine glycosylase